MVPGALMPLHGASVAPALLRAAFSPESRSGGLVLQGSQFEKNQANCISFKREVSTKATLRSVRCSAAQTQTQSVQRKSSTATVKRSDPKGKIQGPKLDDGSGGFPPFRFGKGGGGGGGGGGGSNYFGGFLLFTIVLLLDYLKEFEKHLAARRHIAGDDDHASNGLLEQ